MAATCMSMLPAIGAAVTVRFEKLHIRCKVLDVKNSWGKPRLKIAPEAGSGDQWVELDRIINPTKSTVKAECCPGTTAHATNCPVALLGWEPAPQWAKDAKDQDNLEVR